MGSYPCHPQATSARGRLRYIGLVLDFIGGSGWKRRRVVDRAVLAVALLVASGLRGDGAGPGNAAPDAHSLAGAPPIVLWAWEEPEDLRTADPAHVGVAFLAERVFVGSKVEIVRRHQRILTPGSIWAEAVIRIEATRAFEDNATTRRAAADAVLQAAHLPGIRGVQIDFDATAQQRAFYAEVLRQVRAALPAGEHLEITALVSWCAQPQSWIHALPVDLAVPMNFRLGEHVGAWVVREPLCAGATGISTDEPEGQASALAATPVQKRTVFLFAPLPWTADQLAALNRGNVPHDRRGAR